jgi:hypothetical protein
LNADQKGERIRESLADRSSLTTHEESLFLRQNDYWTIRYCGHAALLKSTRGLHYLAVLLRDPGREFHVRELLARPIAVSTPAAVSANQRVTGGLCAGFPVLDAQAKAEYERRINDLRQDLNQAERFNDLQRKTEVQNELQAIADHLASAVGLGGRDRKTSSGAERARSAVTKCIKKAVQKIGEAIPSLGYHLAARIKTGYFCSYNPHPDRTVAWSILTLTMIALSSFMATAMRADSPHFIRGPTANYDSSTGDLCVSFKEAGLGNTPITYTLTAGTETFTFQCFTRHDNEPQGDPNNVSFSDESTSTTLTPHNGQITGSLCLMPQQDGADCQGHGLVIKLLAASYEDVTFCDSTDNICVSLGDQGGSVTPPIVFP